MKDEETDKGDSRLIPRAEIAMREDIAALLELEQKTKAREIAPLVHVERKGFLLWPSMAYRAYSHRLDIALAQLQLRSDLGVAPDEKAETVVAACKRFYEADGMIPERGKLLRFLRSDDALSVVMELIESDSSSDMGIVALLNICDCLYGKLTVTEIDSIARMKTVGEFATLLKTVAGEGREKGKPLAEGIGCLLLLAVKICAIAYIVYCFTSWLVHRIAAHG